MVIKPPKRPRDLNQWAMLMVGLATGAATDEPQPGASRILGVVELV